MIKTRNTVLYEAKQKGNLLFGAFVFNHLSTPPTILPPNEEIEGWIKKDNDLTDLKITSIESVEIANINIGQTQNIDNYKKLKFKI